MRGINVCIIGGGLSGLTSAYLLSQKYKESKIKINISIIEKESKLGGRIFTKKFNGVPIEFGAQFFVDNGLVLKLAKSLCLSYYILDNNFLSFYLNGKIINRKDKGFLKTFGKEGKNEFNKLEKYLNQTDGNKALKKISFYNWYKYNVGSNLLNFWNRLLISIGVKDLKSINAEFGLILIGVFFGKNYIFKEGLQELISKLEEKLKLNNVEILKNTYCKNIENRNNSYVLKLEKQDENVERTFDRVISAIKPEDLEENYNLNEKKTFKKINGHPMSLYAIKTDKKLWDNTWGVIICEEKSPIYAICDWGNIVDEKQEVPILVICSPFAKKEEIIKSLEKLFPRIKTSKIVFEKNWNVGLHQPNSQISKNKKDIFSRLPEGFYISGDWTVIPALEGAVISGSKSAESLIKEL